MDSWTPSKIAGPIIAIGLIGILGFLTWALVFREVPASNREVLTALVGILSAQVGVVVGAHYGRNVHEAVKDATIDKQADTIKNAQAALSPAEPAIPVGPGESVTVEGKPE